MISRPKRSVNFCASTPFDLAMMSVQVDWMSSEFASSRPSVVNSDLPSVAHVSMVAPTHIVDVNERLNTCEYHNQLLSWLSGPGELGFSVDCYFEGFRRHRRQDLL